MTDSVALRKRDRHLPPDHRIDSWNRGYVLSQNLFENAKFRLRGAPRALSTSKSRDNLACLSTKGKTSSQSFNFSCSSLNVDVLAKPLNEPNVPIKTPVDVAEAYAASPADSLKRFPHAGLGLLQSGQKSRARLPSQCKPDTVRQALERVLGSLAPPAIAVHILRSPDTQGDQCKDSRTSHMKLMPVLQSANFGDTSQMRKRILFICACFSLIRDMQACEKRPDWPQQMTEHQPASGATRRASHMFHKFALSSAGEGIDEKQIKIALNFGKKLQVVDAIGQSLGLGSGLSILLGYECVTLSNLTFKDIAKIRLRLGQDKDLCRRVRSFSTVTNRTWRAFKSGYHNKYGKSPKLRSSQSKKAKGILPGRFLDHSEDGTNERGTSNRIASISKHPVVRNKGQKLVCEAIPTYRNPTRRFSAPALYGSSRKANGRKHVSQSPKLGKPETTQISVSENSIQGNSPKTGLASQRSHSRSTIVTEKEVQETGPTSQPAVEKQCGLYTAFDIDDALGASRAQNTPVVKIVEKSMHEQRQSCLDTAKDSMRRQGRILVAPPRRYEVKDRKPLSVRQDEVTRRQCHSERKVSLVKSPVILETPSLDLKSSDAVLKKSCRVQITETAVDEDDDDDDEDLDEQAIMAFMKLAVRAQRPESRNQRSILNSVTE